MESENHTYSLLGQFWFGVLCGAWDIATVIHKAKEFLSADYTDDDDKKGLCNKMKSYLLILLKTDAVTPENVGLVKEYMEHLYEYDRQTKKNDIFDWYTGDG